MTTRKDFLGFLLCSWARPVPYHKTKGLKSIEFFGDLKRRWESADREMSTGASGNVIEAGVRK